MIKLDNHVQINANDLLYVSMTDHSFNFLCVLCCTIYCFSVFHFLSAICQSTLNTHRTHTNTQIQNGRRLICKRQQTSHKLQNPLTCSMFNILVFRTFPLKSSMVIAEEICSKSKPQYQTTTNMIGSDYQAYDEHSMKTLVIA